MKHSSLKTLSLMSLMMIISACNDSSSEFFQKEDLMPIKSDNVLDISDVAPVVEKPAPEDDKKDDVIKDDICLKDPKACDLKPVVSKPGVVTMLLAFGDLVNDKVVITEGSARLLAQNSVKYASHIDQPKILVVKDHNNNGESDYDTEYIAKVLLSNYTKVDVLNEPSSGLKASHLEGYDLIWFNNPGHAMGSKSSMKALMEFKGGVILSGDDLTQGNGFSMEALTGLKYIDNGTSVSCGGKSYYYDNNDASGYRYQVEISTQFLSGIPEELRIFEYGNDIDNSSLVADNSKLEVLAYAKGAEGTCESKRPVIVRYEK